MQRTSLRDTSSDNASNITITTTARADRTMSEGDPEDEDSTGEVESDHPHKQVCAAPFVAPAAPRSTEPRPSRKHDRMDPEGGSSQRRRTAHTTAAEPADPTRALLQAGCGWLQDSAAGDELHVYLQKIRAWESCVTTLSAVTSCAMPVASGGQAQREGSDAEATGPRSTVPAQPAATGRPQAPCGLDREVGW